MQITKYGSMIWGSWWNESHGRHGFQLPLLLLVYLFIYLCGFLWIRWMQNTHQRTEGLDDLFLVPWMDVTKWNISWRSCSGNQIFWHFFHISTEGERSGERVREKQKQKKCSWVSLSFADLLVVDLDLVDVKLNEITSQAWVQAQAHVKDFS